LKEAFYPDDAIEFAVNYCKDKHYIDDLDYAVRYISIKSEKDPIRMMEKKLRERGIERDILEKAFQEAEISEDTAVENRIKKKYGDITGISFEEKQKLIRKLMSAGFSYDAVKAAVSRLS
jgi:regulatory protein